MDDLGDDVLDRILSWLPTSCFFRMSSIFKRWKSSKTSKSFKLACFQIPTRDPWFFMIDSDSNSSSFVSTPLKTAGEISTAATTVAVSSPSLRWFALLPLLISGEFLLRNPLTGSSRNLPCPICQDNNKPLQAVAMTTTVTTSSYKLVTISGEIPNLSSKDHIPVAGLKET